MADISSIEWTDATWNPTTGCTKISQGCKECYAAVLSKRLKAMGQIKYRNDFEFTEHPQAVELPLKWKKPRRIFVNSMSDLFHEKARMEYIGACFDVMVRASQHVYQVLTKRPSYMAEFADHFEKFYGYTMPQHIWMGTSIENNDTVHRIDSLRTVKAKIRFISFEPLLEKLDAVNLTGIDWAIIGGESGANFRPVREEWISTLIEQCEEQHVPVFFKQWGGIRPTSGGRTINGRTYSEYPVLKDDPRHERPRQHQQVLQTKITDGI